MPQGVEYGKADCHNYYLYRLYDASFPTRAHSAEIEQLPVPPTQVLGAQHVVASLLVLIGRFPTVFPGTRRVQTD